MCGRVGWTPRAVLREVAMGMVRMLAATVVGTIAVAARAQDVAVSYRNFVNLGDKATDQLGQTFTVTGMSGLCYVGPGSGAGVFEFLAVMDNSKRLVRIEAVIDGDGTLAGAGIVGGITLDQTRDFEGIARAPEPWGTVFVSEEGTPAVREFRLGDGATVRALETPPVFATRRANNGLESLAMMPDLSSLWTANEEALTADGAPSTPSAGTVVRLVRYDEGDFYQAAREEFAYLTDPMHGSVIDGAKCGLSDLTALPGRGSGGGWDGGGAMLALERSFALSLSGFFRTRIYEVEFRGASDVSAMQGGLIGETYTALGKRLLYEGDQQNLEGLCVGPRLSATATEERWALVGVVDDGDPISVNRVVGFELVLKVCRADFNGDGVLNINDFIAFQAGWKRRDAGADFDGSGSWTINDFVAFQGAFVRGCA